jgi:hypothetical protein
LFVSSPRGTPASSAIRGKHSGKQEPPAETILFFDFVDADTFNGWISIPVAGDRIYTDVFQFRRELLDKLAQLRIPGSYAAFNDGVPASL